MINIKILSKFLFDETMRDNNITDSNVSDFKNYALISIHDADVKEKNIHTWFDREHDNVLKINFDDIDKEKVKMHLPDGKSKYAYGLTLEQGERIFRFIRDKSQQANNSGLSNPFTFIVHCTAGISRSGAIGEFICDYNGLSIEQLRRKNPDICPNSRVKKILNELWQKELDGFKV